METRDDRNAPATSMSDMETGPTTEGVKPEPAAIRGEAASAAFIASAG